MWSLKDYAFCQDISSETENKRRRIILLTLSIKAICIITCEDSVIIHSYLVKAL